jgi:hypothetical protein
MQAPSPPPTPDPFKTAAAQQMANVEVSYANTVLQNADEDRPDGTVRFEEQTDVAYPTHTYDGDGNITGTRNIFRWKKKVELTPKGKQAFEQSQEISIAMNQAALTQARQLTTRWQSPFSLSLLPVRADTPVAPTLQRGAPARRAFIRNIGESESITAELESKRSKMLERLNWQIDVDRSNKLADLRFSGITEGTTAWERAMRPFSRQMDDARLQVEGAVGQEHTRLVELSRHKADFHNGVVEKEFQLDAMSQELSNKIELQSYEILVNLAQYVNTVRAQAMQEFLGERSQITNEVSALMRGGQIQIPQFQQFQAGKISDTPVGEYVYRSASMDIQKWQMETQQQGQMFGGMMGMVGNLLPMMMSDRRLKADVVKVSNDARGFGWYVWRYLWDKPGTTRYGVMAQEVRHIRGAVVETPSGFLAVNYGVLAQ